MTTKKTQPHAIPRRDMFKLGAAAVVGGLALAAAPRSSALAHGDSGAEKLVIEMGEFYFQVPGQAKNAPITLRAGESYKIEYKNVGKVKHEVAWGRTVATRDGQPHGYKTNLFRDVELSLEREGWEVETEGLTEIELEAGEAMEMNVTVPASVKGEWEIACFIPGHFEAGQKAKFIVA